MVLEFFKIAIITIFVLSITFLIVKICKFQLKNEGYLPGKVEFLIKILNERIFWVRFRLVMQYVNEIWNNLINMLPNQTLNISIIITIILLIITKARKQVFIYYLFIISFIFISCFAPILILNVGICGRIHVPIMMIFGISALFLIANTNYEEINYKYKIAIAFTAICFLINGIFIIQNTAEHIAANRVDHNTGATLNALIENYERQNNIKVTKFGYRFDYSPSQYSYGIRHMQSMTERKFACMWSITYTMNYYCNRKFELVDYIEQENYNYLFDPLTNYDEFQEKQIHFKDDTIYMIVY